MPTEGGALERVEGLARELSSLVTSGDQRTFWGYLVAAALIGLVVSARAVRRGGKPLDLAAARAGLRVMVRRWGSRSSRVDLGLVVLRPMIFGMFAFLVVPWVWSTLEIARAVAGSLDQWSGVPSPGRWSVPAVTGLYTVVLFVAWDASRFLLHWAMHRVPALWQLHQVHHSAEVLTPFTLYRVHPLESALYVLRGVLVTGVVTGLFFHFFRGAAAQWQLLGVNGLGAMFSMIGGNLRHSHVHWSWGRLERWLISPAQHQLHHGPDGTSTNYGTWLALWDRWAGSLRTEVDAPRRFGLDADALNHRPDSVVSALIDPLRAMVTDLRNGTGAVAQAIVRRP
jgi:sterol desaturase/sphingolipid hydroxylase (fatty acid hydroxylase superfamily)